MTVAPHAAWDMVVIKGGGGEDKKRETLDWLRILFYTVCFWNKRCVYKLQVPMFSKRRQFAGSQFTGYFFQGLKLAIHFHVIFNAELFGE